MVNALIGALAGSGSIAGNFASNFLQFEQQKKLQEAQQQWLENMSNTAHQREMNDLRAAGLNPLLTVMGGSGATTPSSGMGQVGQQDFGESIKSGISSALQIRQQKNTNKLTESQIMNLNAQTDTEKTKQDLNIANAALNKSNELLNKKNLSWIDRTNAKLLKKIGSEIFLNNATAAANQSNAQARKSEVTSANELRKAENKYTNERSRGFEFRFGPFTKIGNQAIIPKYFDKKTEQKKGKWKKEIGKNGKEYWVYDLS